MVDVNDSRCPFCEPDVEGAVFAESENFRAVYYIAPILPGHSLIVPKQHLQSLMALSDPALGEMMVFSRNVVRVLLQVFGAAAFNWTVQEGVEAGQTVPHFHLHLTPRKTDDLPQPGDWYPLLRKSEAEIIDSELRSKLTSQEMAAMVNRIKRVTQETKLYK